MAINIEPSSRGAPAPDGLGDGEAAAIAVAAHRGLDIALDDRKARRIIGGRFPRLQMFWTVDLLRAPSLAAVLGAARAADLFDRATIDRLTAPHNYLGLAPKMVDRVLAAAPRDA